MPWIDVHIDEADNPSQTFTDQELLRLFWPYVRPEARSLLYAVLLLPFVSLTQILQPFVIRWALDGPIQHRNWPGLWHYVLIYLGLLVVYNALRFLQMRMAQLTGQKIVFHLRMALYRHLQKLSARFFHKHPLGKLVTRLTSDVENVSEIFASGGIAIFADLALIAGTFIGMFVMSWPLALTVLCMVPIVACLMEFFRRRSRTAYSDVRLQAAGLNAFTQESLSGMEIIQAFRQEDNERDRFSKLNLAHTQAGLRSVFYDSTFTASIELMTFVTLTLILWVAGVHILQGAMTFGLLVAFMQFTQMIFEPVEDLSDKFTIVQSGLASIEKIMDLQTVPPEIQTAERPYMPKQALRGSIQFDAVSFGYLPDKPILKDFSLSIEAGQTVAIVGPTGAGKSTLIRLLDRLYDVDAGVIRLDGIDIRDYALEVLRQSVVVVPQEDFLFSRTVAENIALTVGMPLDMDAVRRAAQSVHADRLIERLPYGYETVLEERGKNLSAGERQLLIFARAFYHQPRVLVLDEATAAIDPGTEALIQSALDTLLADRTAILIAHRLSTVEKADVIVVLKDGQIVESGAHQTLLDRHGLYAQFHEAQTLGV